MDRLRLGLVAVVVGNKTHIYQNGAKHRVERKASQWLQPSPGGLVAPCWQLETRNLMSLLGRVVFHWFCMHAQWALTEMLLSLLGVSVHSR